MNMQEHIVAALADQCAAWETLLASLSEEQITAPQSPSQWSLKDIMAHLWAWQQRSIARVTAALNGQAPIFPQWLPESSGDADAHVEEANASIYATCHAWSWERVHHEWQTGFARFLMLAAQVSEPDFLDGGRYPWLHGRPLAFILLASYDHHQEHLDKANAWLAAAR